MTQTGQYPIAIKRPISTGPYESACCPKTFLFDRCSISNTVSIAACHLQTITLSVRQTPYSHASRHPASQDPNNNRTRLCGM